MSSTPPSSATFDDVFKSEGNAEDVIVDADLIEAVKENIQPLQKGRRATALSAIFSTPHVQRDSILSRQRERLRLQVTQALEDHEDEEDSADPLDVYSRFVAWTLESYPQGQSAESGLLELLEESTRNLKDIESYKQDKRYIKLWILYAGYVDKPADIYSYLLANEIGTDLAQLYEEYAYILERDGRYREADEVFSLGIARKVEPLDHLQKRHADFQRRMVVTPIPPPQSPPRPVAPPAAGRRTVLSENTVSKPCPPIPPLTDVFITPQSNARINVFIDPTGEGDRRAEGNAWPDIGTRASRTKENIVAVRKMADGPLPRSRHSQRSVSGPSSRIIPFVDPPTGSAFLPYRDEPDEDGTMPPPSRTTSSRRIISTPKVESFRDTVPPITPIPTFTPYKDKTTGGTFSRPLVVSTPMNSLVPCSKEGSSSEAEALRRDPFKNYDVRQGSV